MEANTILEKNHMLLAGGMSCQQHYEGKSLHLG